MFTWGAMPRPTLAAAEDGIDIEVVDLWTLSPMDTDAIVDSFKKTGRAVVVHEAPKTGGLAGEITATTLEIVTAPEPDELSAARVSCPARVTVASRGAVGTPTSAEGDSQLLSVKRADSSRVFTTPST